MRSMNIKQVALEKAAIESERSWGLFMLDWKCIQTVQNTRRTTWGQNLIYFMQACSQRWTRSYRLLLDA